MSNVVKVFAPATVANVACGFDIMGLALEAIGDELTITATDDDKLSIGEIVGADNIPVDPDKNVCTVAIKALLDDLGKQQGFKVDINKHVAPGSGLGSSASSAAGAVFGANELLGNPYSRQELVRFAMEGERVASEKAHADNVAPSLMGGFAVIRSYTPLDVFTITYPEELALAIIYPSIEVKTADAKKILKTEVALSAAITQWGNVAGLTAGLINGDFGLIQRSLQDVIVEPIRSILIPCYDAMKVAALEAGALGCNISGSGPSVFAMCKGTDAATEVAKAMGEVLTQFNVDYDQYISKVNKKGCEVLESSAHD
ncbi:MAG: homoserine kinase [Bacteroidota bacterium]